MRHAVIFTIAAALSALAFGCEKDSFGGLSNDQLDWRTGGGEIYRQAPKMKAFEASYQLIQAEALPGGPAFLTRERPKDAEIKLYGLRGEAAFLYRLDPAMSYEIHFVPRDKNPVKDTFNVWVEGILTSSPGHDCLKYAGDCTYYPDGKRIYHYEFTGGAGPFEKVSGWMESQGQSYEAGQFMEFEAKGEMSMPALED